MENHKEDSSIPIVTEEYKQQSALCLVITEKVAERYNDIQSFLLSSDAIADKDYAVNTICIIGLSEIFNIPEEEIKLSSSRKACRTRDYIYYILSKRQRMTFREIQKLYPTTAHTHIWKKVNAMSVWLKNYDEEKLVIGALEMAINEIFNTK